MQKSSAKRKFGRVIARRTLPAAAIPLQDIVISIGAPVRRPKGNWECRYRIEGLSEPLDKLTGGADSLQALQMAIEGVWVSLERAGCRYTWRNGEAVPAVPRFMPEYDQDFDIRIKRAMDRESKRYWGRKLKNRKTDIAKLEAELKERRDILSGLEGWLKRRKAATTIWEANMKEWKAG